jgi:hypothetical protein
MFSLQPPRHIPTLYPLCPLSKADQSVSYQGVEPVAVVNIPAQASLGAPGTPNWLLAAGRQIRRATPRQRRLDAQLRDITRPYRPLSLLAPDRPVPRQDAV